jgi:hypothetical protein
MKIWIDDAYTDIMLAAMIKREKKMIEFFLNENDYINADDRLADEELIHGFNILLKYYEVQSDIANVLETTPQTIKYSWENEES